MYYLKMRPDQIKDAVKRNVPVILSSGSVEYHGPHLPIGTDFLIADAVVEKVEQQCECIVLPPLPYAPTMFWAGDEKDGEFDFNPDILYEYAREILTGIVKVGFKRIYILQHHQGNEGLPALTLRKAAVDVIRQTAKTWSKKWGWSPDDQLPNSQLFGMIRVAYVDSFSQYPTPESERIPIGHGSKGETQLIMSSYPETVKMEELDKLTGNLPLWLEDSHLATKEEGDMWVEFCVKGWVEELSREG